MCSIKNHAMNLLDALGEIGQKGFFPFLKKTFDYTFGGAFPALDDYVSFSGKSKRASDYYTGWVGSAVDAISEEVSEVELTLMRRKKTGEDERVKEHPALSLLFSPNRIYTKKTLIYRMQASMELWGEEFWLLLPNGRNQPAQILPLRSSNMDVIPDPDKYIKGYRYLTAEGYVELPIEMVVHFKQYNPKSDIRGLSTLSKARIAADTDESASEYSRAFFENDARPGVILQYKGTLDQDQISRMKRQWDQEHKGPDKRDRVAVAQNGLEIKVLDVSQADMQFLEGRKFSRDEIFAIFRVPKTAFGITEDVNYSNGETSRETFASYCIKPKMTGFVDSLNKFYLPLFGDDTLYFTFKSPVPENQEKKLAYYQSGFQNGWLTQNEIRRREGLTEVEGGDATYLPFNLVAGGQAMKMPVIAPTEHKQLAKTMAAAMLKELESVTVKVIDKPETKSGIELQARETTMDRTIFEIEGQKKSDTMAKRAVKFEKKYADTAKKLFKDQRAKAIGNLETELNQKDWHRQKAVLLDDDLELKLTIDLFTPLFNNLTETEARAALDALGIDPDDFNLSSPNVQAYIKRNLRKFAGQITDTTTQEIRALIAAGIEQGESFDQLKDRIASYSGFSDARAEMIARSEVIRGQTEAELNTWQETGIVTEVVWYTALDERVCPICYPLHGEQVAIKSAFLTADEMSQLNIPNYDGSIKGPPAHPQCRCTLLPVTNGKSYVKRVPSEGALVAAYLDAV